MFFASTDKNTFAKKGDIMAKKHSSFLVAFPVSSVYFGALVGPSMVSGVFAAVYFAPYGAWGLILPLVTMGLAAFIVACGMIGVSHWGVYDYSSYAKKALRSRVPHPVPSSGGLSHSGYDRRRQLCHRHGRHLF